MGEITYVRGDATTPSGKGVKVIAHVCNDLGGWGKGFVLALSRRWPEPEKAYRAWHRDRANNDFGLGAVQLVQVERYIWVANMIGQRGTRTGSKGVPVRYEAIDTALAELADEVLDRGASVHMPRIGCGLAGGKWSRIEPVINERLVARRIPVTVYDHGDEAPR
ncbi:macro domain-containing protein [Streptomyces sp. Ag109_O5-10]|uniref:macro domain-containing protein n=1 Tax=Streptomyces sp. Ag109_O5-10 TaxID=1855349 RepID=UPI000897AE53|nr:macro domain-containing protein [Streptomyces sp. Ag109_O5-10]SEE03049.1 O-acetyl-ADP-ribose deacetylase (regulator of RNase III), contains Macro domain [Streptomyces sp. Ag109_O5-10]